MPCPECGRVAQPCSAGCGGFSRAGSFFCRACGEVLAPGWRDRSWSHGLRLDSEPRVVESLPEGGRAGSFLGGGDPWLLLSADRQVELREPGPALAVVSRVALRPEEVAAGLYPVRARSLRSGGETASLPGWELWTSRRRFELDPQRMEWKAVELFADGRGEMLWRSRFVAAFQARSGFAVYSDDVPEPLLRTEGVLSEPAWLDDTRLVCAGRQCLYVVDSESSEEATIHPTGVDLAPGAPLFDPVSGRLFLAGLDRIYWCRVKEEASVRPIPFADAGGATMAPGPNGVVLLESDRIRYMSSDGRMLWDSRRDLPDLARSPHGWDRAGEVLLVPLIEGRRHAFLLLDLQRPESPQVLDLDGVAETGPRLAPGGVAAVRTGPDGAELLWFGEPSKETNE